MGRYTNTGLGAGTLGSPQISLEQSEYTDTINNLMNKLPPNDPQIKHIFRNDEGHLPDTPENRKLVQKLANSPDCYLGNDKFGNCWYSKLNSDGSQLWVQVRNGIIQNAGKNLTPKVWNKETGLSRGRRQVQRRKNSRRNNQ